MPAPTGFKQARNFTAASADRGIRWLVLHAMQNAEKPGTARRVCEWFAGPTAPRASTHKNFDAAECWRSVLDKDVAWGASGANRQGLHYEHCGFSEQSSANWSDAFSTAMLQLSAEHAADDLALHGLPIAFCFAADLRAGRPGVTTHAQVEEAFPSSGHWDPGLYFPVAHYLNLIRSVRTGQPAPPRVVFEQEVDVATIKVELATCPGIDTAGNGFADVGPFGTVGDVSLNMGGYPKDPARLITYMGRGDFGGQTRTYWRGPAGHPPFGILVERRS